MEILSDSWTLIIAIEAAQLPIGIDLLFFALFAVVLPDLRGEWFTGRRAQRKCREFLSGAQQRPIGTWYLQIVNRMP
jgi:hypothetical protein